jgi:hypothetical protein
MNWVSGLNPTYESDCTHNGFINLKIAGFDVNRHNFALVTRFDLLANARLAEFLPSLG